MTSDLRRVIIVAALAIAVLAGAHWSGVAAESHRAAIAAARDTIAQLHASVRRDSIRIAALQDTVAAAVAPHESAQREMDREIARSRSFATRARAAAASDSLALEDARRLLAEGADRIDSLIRRHAAERATASTRVSALERTVAVTIQSRSTLRELAAAQGRLAEQALRRRPWYQRAAGALCAAGLTGSGAGAGAAVGGPVGAAVGGISGLVAGRVACP